MESFIMIRFRLKDRQTQVLGTNPGPGRCGVFLTLSKPCRVSWGFLFYYCFRTVISVLFDEVSRRHTSVDAGHKNASKAHLRR